MVGLFKALLPSLLLATFAVAQNDFNVTNPTSSSWWVAKSTNVMSWDCQNSQAKTDNNFTILIKNADQNILSGELAIIAIQNNFQCTVTISQNQANQLAATGYTLLFANTLNSSDVYTSSQPFEIKPLGSLYPSQVSSSASAASATAAASTASASSNSGAAYNSHSPSFLGLAAGIMGLLTAGLLGA